MARVENVYNGRDERVKETKTLANGAPSTRRFVYDLTGRLLGEYGTGTTDVYAEHIWLNPDPANDNASPYGGDDAIGGYAPLAIAVGTGSGSNTSLAWVASDHLGVPVMLLDGTGAPMAAPTTITLHAFPGQMKTLPDLYYNRYRDYDPTTGRYIQADPIGLAGDVNPYLYAGGNPVRHVDPNGLECIILFSEPNMRSAAELACREFDRPNTLNIFGHGNPLKICYGDGRDGRDCRYAGEFFKENRRHFIGKSNITVFACNTGRTTDGFAQQLANVANTPTLAPNQYTWWNKNKGYTGTYGESYRWRDVVRGWFSGSGRPLGPKDITNPGQWNTFYPQNRK